MQGCDNMYEVYTPIVYNNFLKSERKKRKLKLEELSKQIHYSLGFVSQLENSIDPLCNEKISILFSFYNYESNYLISFDKQLTELMDSFIQEIFLINDAGVNASFNQLKLFFSKHSNEELLPAYHLVQFIYHLYFYSEEKADYYCNLVLQNSSIYSNKYLSYAL